MQLQQGEGRAKVMPINFSSHYDPLFIIYVLLATSFLNLHGLTNKSVTGPNKTPNKTSPHLD